MFAGQGITWILTAVTLALLPRYLGPGQMGSLGIGVSFSLLAGVVAGLGMATLITREIARDREAGRSLLATALWLQTGLGVAGALACIGLGIVLGYGRTTQFAIGINAATVPFNLLILLGFGALQGAEVMRHQAIWDSLNKLALLAALVVIAFFDLGFSTYLGISLFSAVLSAVPGVVLMHRYLPFRVFSFSPALARKLIVWSLPFCTFGIVLAVYPAVDIFLLSILSGEEAVGLYATPVRIFGTLLFGPSIIMTVVFPRLAATSAESGAQLRRIARTTLQVVVGVTVPVALLTAGAGSALLPRLVGQEFADSAPVLLLLSLVLVSTSINMVAHRVLIAVDRQKQWTAVMCGALAAKVLLDLAFIPVFESWVGNPALGAAAAFLLVETAMVASAFALLPKGIVDRPSARLYGRLALAAAVSAGAMLAVRPAGFAAVGLAGALSYACVALAVRAVTIAELLSGARWLMGRQFSPAYSPTVSPLAEALLGAPERFKGVRAPVFDFERKLPRETGAEFFQGTKGIGRWVDAKELTHSGGVGHEAHNLRSTRRQPLHDGPAAG